MPPVNYHSGVFPPDGRLDWPKLIPLIGPAAAAVARYDGLLSAIPNPDVLLAPLSSQEAVLSSRIEGTEATLGEVLEFEAGREAKSPAKRDDIREIVNYRAAMRHAQNLLKELPLSERVVRSAHKVLLSGGRGASRSPGDYRRTANWIGPPGCSMEQARFVPLGAENLAAAMSEWERYIHGDSPDKLVQLGILHAEFEALHPFLDGNGRMGRMMVPLFMWQKNLIQQPVFYISAYFEANRDVYYERLLAVSRDDDWTGWCRYFLAAVQAQAEDNLAKVQGIMDLYEAMKSRVADLTRSRYAIHALDWIFEHPIFRSTSFVESAGIPAPTARRFLRVLHEGEILRMMWPSRGRQAAYFVFPALLTIAEGNSIL